MKKIAIANPVFNGNERRYINNCIDTGWISSIGSYITKFESKFSRFLGSKFAASCSNGTVALHLPLLALGVKPGDEVIVPTLTYIATANAVAYCGAKPIFVDSEPRTWNIDPSKIEAKINKKTKGIIVVHLYGHPVDMDPVMKLAKKYNLFVIEDAAEAHGAEYKNKRVGSIGDAGVFSFFGNKIITAGEGGMVVTNNKKIDEKIRLYKGQGQDPKRRYWFIVTGYNYRMTNIQAAVGLAQLEKINWHMKMRRKIASLYDRYLKELSGYVDLPIEENWAKHSYWMYSILLKDNLKISRDNFMNLMAKKGIETRPVFYPMHVMPPFYAEKESFPVAEKISSRGINIPTHALLTKNDIKYISRVIKDICLKFGK